MEAIAKKLSRTPVHDPSSAANVCQAGRSTGGGPQSSKKSLHVHCREVGGTMLASWSMAADAVVHDVHTKAQEPLVLAVVICKIVPA